MFSLPNLIQQTIDVRRDRRQSGRVICIFVGPERNIRNIWSSFYVVGALFDAAYVGGNSKNKLTRLQSISIDPGDGGVIEFVLDEPGTCPFVTHSFGHASYGAGGLFVAT